MTIGLNIWFLLNTYTTSQVSPMDIFYIYEKEGPPTRYVLLGGGWWFSKQDILVIIISLRGAPTQVPIYKALRVATPFQPYFEIESS